MKQHKYTTKNEDNAPINLFDELLAIQDGACVYCAHGLEHPSYSCCTKKKVMRPNTLKIA